MCSPSRKYCLPSIFDKDPPEASTLRFLEDLDRLDKLKSFCSLPPAPFLRDLLALTDLDFSESGLLLPPF
jgi:hypothetical protein